MGFLLEVLFVILFVTIGMTIVFRKKKLTVDTEEVEWGQLKSYQGLSESQRSVHIKEMRRELPRIYSMAWFKQYWRGERSFMYAFWAPWFLIMVPVRLFYVGLRAYLEPLKGEAYVGLVLLFFNVVFFVFYVICMWRCSKNSRKAVQIFARIYIVLFSLCLLFLAYQVFF